MAPRLTDRQRLDRDLLERDFQVAYTRALRALGFQVAHHYDSRFSDPGTRGFPDLTVVGYDHLWFDELKREKGIVSPEQKEWHRSLRLAGQLVNVCRPHMWDDMLMRAESIAGQAVAPGLRSFPVSRPRRKKNTRGKAVSQPQVAVPG